MSTEKTYIKWINNFDLMQIPITLSYKNEYTYRTASGAIFTLLITIIMLIYIINNFIDLILKSNFTIITNNLEDLTTVYDFSDKPILIQLSDSKGNLIKYDSKLFSFSAMTIESKITYDKNGMKISQFKQTNLEIVNCTQIKSEYLSYFSSYDLNDYLCFNSGQDIKVYGSFGDNANGYSGFRIYVNRCDSSKRECYSNEYTNSKMKNAKFRIVYLNYRINHYNKVGNYVEEKVSTDGVGISLEYMKKSFLFLDLGKYISYDNIFLNNKKEKNFFAVDRNSLEFDSNGYNSLNPDGSSLFYYNVCSNGNLIEYKRTVKKLSELISDLGGIFNIILTLSKIANGIISKNILFQDVYDYLFSNANPKKSTSSVKILPKLKLSQNYKKRIEKNERNDRSSIILLGGMKPGENQVKRSVFKQKSITFDAKDRKFDGTYIDKPRSLCFIYYFLPFLLKNHEISKYLRHVQNTFSKYFSIESILFLMIYGRNNNKKESFKSSFSGPKINITPKFNSSGYISSILNLNKK